MFLIQDYIDNVYEDVLITFEDDWSSSDSDSEDSALSSFQDFALLYEQVIATSALGLSAALDRTDGQVTNSDNTDNVQDDVAARQP